MEDPNPDPTLHEEAVGASEESSDVETECEVTNSHSLHTPVEELDLVTRNRVVEAEPVGVEEEDYEKEVEGKRKTRGIVKRKRRRVDKGKGVFKGRGVPCLGVSQSRLVHRSRRVTMQQKVRSLTQQTSLKH